MFDAPVPQTLLQAATYAFHYAQNQAAGLKTRIATVHLQGEEFLTLPDIRHVTGNVYPVEKF